MNASIKWKSGHAPSDLATALQRKYGLPAHTAAAKALMDRFAPDIESHAKALAPWTDRTGNARQSLFSVTDAEGNRVTLYLSHGVEYGVYLELSNQGRYAIILPTLERYYPIVKKWLQDMYR